MNDPDLEMEERLRRFARESRTPPLPADSAALPWTVQGETQSPLERLLSALGALPARAGRGTFATVRLGATLALAFGMLLAVSQTHAGGSGAAFVEPPLTPRPSVAPGDATGSEVVVLPTSGVVDDVMADYIAGGVHRAEADGAAAVIIELDTLGGSETAMMRIVQSLHAKVPTIVWVGPSGAKAASAGTFITLAGNLAYMAPSTNIGAASPVAAGGGDIATIYGPTEAAKVMADAVATIRSIAQERHPAAVDWAVTTVEKAQSYSAQEALAVHAINGTAINLDDVLNQADGQQVTVVGAQVTVHTKGAHVVTVNEDIIQSVLHGLDDPNIAFILFVLGVLAIGFELFHPTLIGAVAGALALALSFYGSGSLPLNVLGVVLVTIGLAMILAEPHLPSHGLLTVGGIGVFIVGAVAFYGSPGPFEAQTSVAWPVIAVMVAAAAAFAIIVVQAAITVRHRPVSAEAQMVGLRNLAGTGGEVRKPLAPVGTVYASGEEWSARTRDGGTVATGSKVRVVGQEGLTLIVEPLPQG
jgi:membrane-bound serine protease (ClpP class)